MKTYVKHSDLVRGEVSLNYEQVGKVSAESVLKHTGKNWQQWIMLLNKAGASTWNYREIVSFLQKKQKLTPWWQQGVALGFEIATGRRSVGQDAKGKYTVTATKSLPFDVQKVWGFLISPVGIQIWLKPLFAIKILPKTQFETSDGFFGEIRTLSARRRIRMFWQEADAEKPTVVELHLVSRPKGKSLLVFSHTGIRELKAKENFRSRWRSTADQISLELAKVRD